MNDPKISDTRHQVANYSFRLTRRESRILMWVAAATSPAEDNDLPAARCGESRTFVRQVLIFKRPPGSTPVSLTLYSLSPIPCLSRQQLCTPTGRFIRFGTCHEAAAVAVAVAAPVTGRRRLHCSPLLPPKRPAVLAVLGTCFTADTRLLLLLPARYAIARLCVVPSRPRFLAQRLPPAPRYAPRDVVAARNFVVC